MQISLSFDIMKKAEITTSSNEVEPAEAWLTKRKITTYAFVVETFFLGVEYSVFFLTVWLYIKTLVKPSNPKLIYSITSTAYLLSSMLLSMIIGKIADVTREINILFLISNILVTIGNILYTLHFSVYYLIFGRLIAGAVSPLRCVISGELARSYLASELSPQITVNGMAFSLGFVVGPAINFLFLDVDITINGWHITVANAAGVFMAIIFLILAIAMYFLVHNLSQKFDLKNEIEKLEEKGYEYEKKLDTNDSEITEANFLLGDIKKSYLKDIYIRGEVLLMFFCSFFFYFIVTYFNMTTPLMILDVLNQTAKELNAVIFSTGVASIILAFIFIKIRLSQKALYYSFLGTITIGIVALTSFCLIKINGGDNVSNIVLWIIFVLCFGPFCILQEVFLISTFAKVVPSSEQIFGESIRLAFERLGSIIALMVSAYVFDSSELFTILSCIILVFVMIYALVKKNSLENPKYNSFE